MDRGLLPQSNQTMMENLVYSKTNNQLDVLSGVLKHRRDSKDQSGTLLGGLGNNGELIIDDFSASMVRDK